MKSRSSWYFLATVLTAALICMSSGAYLPDFLTINRPVAAELLVVEGWLYDCMLDQVVAEIKRGGYTTVLISGFEGKSGYAVNTGEGEGMQSNAVLLKDKFVAKGIEASLITVVLAKKTQVHRTFQSALAIRQWFSGKNIEAVNVLTGGTHGRKTFVVYKRVLGVDIETGIVSIPVTLSDSGQWWSTRKGFRVTWKHFVGYVYALFWPYWIDSHEGS